MNVVTVPSLYAALPIWAYFRAPGEPFGDAVAEAFAVFCCAYLLLLWVDETSIDTLEFTVDGNPVRVEGRGPFGVLWGPSRGMKARVPILYLRDNPTDARLADFSARFTMPLILMVLGLMLAPAGWLLCRDSKRLSN